MLNFIQDKFQFGLIFATIYACFSRRSGMPFAHVNVLMLAYLLGCVWVLCKNRHVYIISFFLSLNFCHLLHLCVCVCDRVYLRCCMSFLSVTDSAIFFSCSLYLYQCRVPAMPSECVFSLFCISKWMACQWNSNIQDDSRTRHAAGNWIK